jgi:hypothetical protein
MADKVASRPITAPVVTNRMQAKHAVEQRKKLDALMALLGRQLVTGTPCSTQSIKEAAAWMDRAQMLSSFHDRIETSHLCAYPGCDKALGSPSLRRFVFCCPVVTSDKSKWSIVQVALEIKNAGRFIRFNEI